MSDDANAADLASLLERSREQIASRFVVEVERRGLSPSGVPRTQLRDHVPRFIAEIAAKLRDSRAAGSSEHDLDVSATARGHGEQRWQLGYDLDGLIREYGVLRRCILDALDAAGARPSIRELEVVSTYLDVGVAEAATEYVAFRDVELRGKNESVELLAEAGELLGSSLDYRSTLGRLTALVLPRLADWCAVDLVGATDGDVLVAHADPAKLDVLRLLFARTPHASGGPFGRTRVVKSGKPDLVPTFGAELVEQAARDAEELALLRALDCGSYMIVPLRTRSSVVGAIVLGRGPSSARYDEGHLVVATDLARRTAAAIDNARLYELAEQARARAEAAAGAKDEFVAMVSHELRTPLNTILGWVRLLRGGTLSADKSVHAIGVVERNANALNRIVADLLDVSRIFVGKVRIEPSDLDFVKVIDMAVEGVRPAADAKRIGIEVDIDVDREQAQLRADAQRLEQLAWNLLANAVKFTPKGGKVTVRLRRVDADLELVVEDNGVGISPSFLPYVFEPFRQSDASASRAHGGLGLGLSIARQIVGLHGGEIEAKSEGLGRGATFVVRIPVTPLLSTKLDADRAEVAPSAPAARATVPPGLEGLSVLVVDDEPDARELIAMFFETCGMSARVAGSVAEAMRQIAAAKPDVIVSDIGMPDEDGYALIRRVRALDGPASAIPAIALTAFARNEDRTRALHAGFDLHMAKPVEPNALVNAVVDLARSRRG
jgi:signal transduction histidine kinase